MNKPLRVVVVGSGGRMGAALVRHLRSTPERFHVVAYDHKAMDLLRPGQIEDHLRAIQFDALINCAAMTSLEGCEDRPEEATQVNVEAPRQMAMICDAVGARMIQISTDYVYDGTQPGLRREGDPENPLSQYARTKCAGDQAVLGVNKTFLSARTSWVFGPDRPSFVDQILLQALRDEEVFGIADKFSVPSSSADLALWLTAILERPAIHGVLNLCNTGQASWHSYAQQALDIARELGWPLRFTTVTGTKLADIKAFRAPRPYFTTMSSELLAREIGQKIRSWNDALREYLETFYSSSPAPPTPTPNP